MLFAHSLFHERVIWGYLIWEIDKQVTFNETVVPSTFWKNKYSYL